MTASDPKPKSGSSISEIKRYRRLKMFRLISRGYYYNRRNKVSELYNLVGDEFLELGGVYIKFLQSLMLQSTGLMRYWKNPRRLTVFEKLETEPIDVEAFLKAELGSDCARLQSVSPEPIAGGSFGQVYSAKLDGRQDVVIKIIRPQIYQLLQFDLKLLRYFWRVFNHSLSKTSSLDISSSFDNFASQTRAETDYIREAEFAHEQYQTYKNHKQLIIPRTYLELCRPKLIVQEYIGGISGSYLVELKQKGVDPKKYIKEKLGSDIVSQLETVAYEIVWGAFSQPRVMGDAHPGNIKLLKNNRVALIDFGISATTAKNQGAFFSLIVEYNNLAAGKFNPGQIFISYLRFFGRDLYRALKKLSSLNRPTIDLNQQLSKIAEANMEHLVGTEEANQIMKSPKALSLLVAKTGNSGNHLGLKIKLEEVQLMRTAVAYNAFLDSLGLYQEVVKRAYSRAIKQVQQRYPGLSSQPEPEMSHRQAIDVVSQWLERVAYRNPFLFSELVVKIRGQQSNRLMINSSNWRPGRS